jgi:hypothetical protein
MTEIKVDTVVDAAGTGKPNFSTGVTVNGAALSTLNLGQYTASSSEPSSPKNGSIWWDTANEKIFIYIAGEWKETIGISPVWYGDRAIMAGGADASFNKLDTINYGSITTSGNFTDFGNLSAARDQLAGASDGTTAIFGGGDDSAITDTIDKVTTSTAANATDFGNLSQARYRLAAVGGKFGIFSGGQTTSAGNSQVNTIDFVTIATSGNATDFGDHTAVTSRGSGATNTSRALFSGMYGDATVNTIEYITNATPSNAIDFGDMTSARYNTSSCADATRAIFAGGFSVTNVMDYFTIASTGNASDFGDLSLARGGLSATNNETKGVFLGGQDSSTAVNNVDIVTIQTTGNAADHGDLTIASRYGGAASGAAS